MSLSYQQRSYQQRSYRQSSVLLACVLPSLLACNAILGVEDLSTDERPDGLGGEDSGSGGDDSDSGGRSSGGKGSGGKGSGGDDSESGGRSSGGRASGGRASSGGDSGDSGGSGGDSGVTSPVTGKIVDFYLRPVPNAEVTIGDQTTETDISGEFTINNVPETYDVTFKVDPDGSIMSWMYVGLSRRDPTLQAYFAFDDRYDDYTLSASNIPMGTDFIEAAFSAPVIPYNSIEIESGYPAAGTVNFAGPSAELNTTVHGLQWSGLYSAAPTPIFTAVASKDALFQGIGTAIEFDSWTSITTANVSGSITSSESEPAGFSLFLRFNDGAALMLLDTTLSTNTEPYEFPAPIVPDAAITVAAYQSPPEGGWAITHADGVVPGYAAPTLTMPMPGEPEAPSPGADGVTSATKFRWSTGTSSPCSVIYIENTYNYQVAGIVTCDSEMTIPDELGLSYNYYDDGYAYDYRWYVETHGFFTTMDELSGSNGVLDSFSMLGTAPLGPVEDVGSYARTYGSGFTMAAP